MSVRRGISLLELLPLPAGVEALVPDEIASQLGLLTVLDYRSVTTDAAFVHTGTAQSMVDALNVNTRGWVFRAPGVTDGLQFRLAVARPTTPPANDHTVEAVGTAWQLDLFLSPVELQLPFRAGDLFTNAEGLVTVQPDPGRQNVWLVGGAVLRVASDPTGHVTVEFVDQPDPFDMNRPTGPVIDLTVTPPTFVFGSTQYGMTLDKFEIDLSSSYTPPDVMARGQDEAWQGLAFKEATFYAPPTTPIVGALSIGLRDVIIGTPFGMQGEMAIQLGQDPSGANFATVTAVREAATGPTNVSVPQGTNGGMQLPVDPVSGTASYHLVFALPPAPVPPPGGAAAGAPDNTPRGIWWQLPNGRQGVSLTTPSFTVPNPGDPNAPLKYRIRVGAAPTTPAGDSTTLPDGQVELAEVQIIFSGPTVTTGPAATPPAKVTVTAGTNTYVNVASITGTHDAIQALGFGTSPADAGARWLFDNGSSGAGATPQLTVPTVTGVHDLVLTSNTATRYVRVEVTAGGPLLIGHGNGPGGNADIAITPDTLAHQVPAITPGNTFDLKTFNASGTLTPSSADATYTGMGDPLTVQPGTLARLTVTWTDDGTQGNSSSANPAPVGPATTTPPIPASSHSLSNYNPNHPEPPDGQYAGLLAWAQAQLPTTSGAPPQTFYVVGRTDDVWLDSTLPVNTSNNTQLAESRAANVQSYLQSHLTPTSAFTVIARGEEDAATGWPDATQFTDANATFVGRLAQPDTPAAAGSHPVWKSDWLQDFPDTGRHATAEADSRRASARRVDVYVATSSQTATTPTDPGDSQPSTSGTPQPNSRTVLVPGEDTPNPPAVKRTLEQASTHRPWMLRLLAKWDSPVVATLADAIPTDCELTVAWAATDTTLPRSAGTVPPPQTGPSGSTIWLLQGRWTYDARSGENAFMLALTLPDSVATFQSDFLAWALTLAPALAGLLPASDVEEEAASFVGLMVIGGTIGALINGSSSGHPHTDSKLHIHKLELDYHGQADSRVSFSLDYSTELHVNLSLFGQSLIGDGLKLKFKNVALEVDFASTTLEGIKLDYSQFSLEVENPGTWALGGALGDLLRIVKSSVGSSSTYLEFELAFAIDLGVISLHGATIRITMNGSNIGFELRGLVVGVDIPNTLSGQGALTISDDGALRGMISVSIIPAKLSAYASLALDPPMVALEMGVLLPVGIPLASTGLAIFGFLGRFVANGIRQLKTLSTGDPTSPNFDPVQRELDWYCAAPQDKYTKQPGEFALGLGVIIGTMPDNGFTFNAEGMIAVSFPDVSVALGIDAMLISQRKSAATETGDSSSVGSSSSRTFRIKGVTVFNPDSLVLGVRGSYVIEKVLDLEIPINGYFPFHSGGPGGDCYLRVGSDGVTSEGRTGTPVQIKLFPGSLDVMAWAYLMIEEHKLHKLGNDPTLNFDGFSIGFGAGFNLDWGGSSVGIHAGAQMLLGVGTNPLTFAGMIGVHGELSLVVVSISFEGDVRFIIAKQPDNSTMWHLHGHFCGSIDCFFFSISGCCDIDFGSEGTNPTPPPPSPVSGIDLTDHLGAIKGKARRNGTSDAVPTVWPDTVPVVHFTHYMEDDAPVSDGFVRQILEPATDSPWCGTNDLKYAFKLVHVQINKLASDSDPIGTPQAGPYDSAWWLPTHRPGVATPNTGASPLEGRELGLMWWNPAPWARWLGEGGDTLPGDPAQTWGNVCNPPPALVPVCALGQNAVQLAPNLVLIVPASPSPSPFSSFFTVSGGLPADLNPMVVQAIASSLGFGLTPGGARNLSAPLNLPNGVTVTGGYMLQQLTREGLLVGSAPFAGKFSTPVVRPSVVMLVCPQRTYQVSACDSFADLQMDSTIASPLVHNGLTYTAGEGTLYVGGGNALAFNKGLKISLPQPVSSVTVTISSLPTAPLIVAGLDASGKTVAQGQGAGATVGSFTDLTLNGANIVTVMLGGGGRPTLQKVCWSVSAASLLGKVYGRVPSVLPALPVVAGTTADGKQIPWTGKVLNAQAAPSPIGIAVGIRCQVVVYTPDIAVAQWSGFEIEPASGASVELLAVCGVTATAVAAQQQDAAVRQSLQNAWQHASGLASGSGSGGGSGSGSGPNSTRPNLLQAGSTYEVRVTWQYQPWRADSTSSAPQSPPPLGPWLTGGTDVFRFKTAAEGVSTPAAKVAGDHFITTPSLAGAVYDESVFDARGLSRYLIGFSPAPGDPPLYLDDTVQANFNADHLQTLLDLYSRTLTVKVRRTDPPPGSYTSGQAPGAGKTALPVIVPAPKHALEIESKLSWGPLPAAMQYPCDARVQTAVGLHSPCLTGSGGFGGTQATVLADLLPDAEYDILLVAAKNSDPDADDVLVARSHFTTSSYHNPTEQMIAMGFGAPITAPWAPHDAIVTGAAPAATLHSDASLTAALAAMGLTAEPVPPRPQTTALWIAPTGGNPWKLAALLLQSDEPLLRDGRLTITSAFVRDANSKLAGTVTLWASNKSATRVLLATAAPFNVPSGSNVVTLVFSNPAAPGINSFASRVLFERPLSYLQEGA